MAAEAVALRILVNVNMKNQLPEAIRGQKAVTPRADFATQDAYTVENILHRHRTLAIRRYGSYASKGATLRARSRRHAAGSGRLALPTPCPQFRLAPVAPRCS